MGCMAAFGIGSKDDAPLFLTPRVRPRGRMARAGSEPRVSIRWPYDIGAYRSGGGAVAHFAPGECPVAPESSA